MKEPAAGVVAGNQHFTMKRKRRIDDYAKDGGSEAVFYQDALCSYYESLTIL